MMATTTAPFFVAGGTVPVGAASYVTREADEQLYTHLIAGEFCYVLTSRQMGKSSLMARTARRLRAEGVQTAVLDLTSYGHVERSAWYFSLLIGLADALGKRAEMRAFWTAESDLDPLQRWIAAVRHLLEMQEGRPLVLFIDEIDNVLALSFPTGEFFAAIRACYNRRSEDPALEWLTFCLLGVANPADLIDDTRLTPFNIGRRIELHDFTRAEAAALEPGLGDEEIVREAVLDRVLHWTGGHPYLTQRLCQAVAESEDPASPALVDQLCDTLFLSSKAREQDDNLVFVSDQLLKNAEGARPDEELASLLQLYHDICCGKPVADDKATRFVSVLKLSGVVRSESGMLKVRNRIYARVFDEAWVRSHMPGAEARRQRRAYRRGLIRSAGVAGLVVAVLSLSFTALYQYNRSQLTQRNLYLQTQLVVQGRHLIYAADMNLLQQAFDKGHFTRVDQLLKAQVSKAGEADLRGFEWGYYHRLMNRDLRTLTHQGRIVQACAFSHDGKTLASGNNDGIIRFWDPVVNAEVGEPIAAHARPILTLACSPRAPLLASGSEDGTVALWDLRTHRCVKRWKIGGNIYSVAISPDGRWLASGGVDGRPVLRGLEAPYARRDLPSRKKSAVSAVAFSPDGRWLVCAWLDGTVSLWEFPNLMAPRDLPAVGKLHASFAAAVSPDSKTLALGRENGKVEVWDLASRRLRKVLDKHAYEVRGVAFSPDGKLLATGSWDMTARTWDARTLEPLDRLIGHVDKVTSVRFSPDSRTLVSTGNNNIKLWDPRRQERNPSVVSITVATGVGQMLNDGALRFISWKAGRLSVRNLTNGNVLILPVALPVEPLWPALSPDGKTLATSSPDGTVSLWDTETGVRVGRLIAETRRNPDGKIQVVCRTAFSPDGKRIAVSSGDPGVVTIWDIGSTTPIDRFQYDNTARGIAFSPNGQSVVAAGWSGLVYWHDIGKETIRWSAHAKIVDDVAFSKDGKTLATCSQDGSVRLWNVATKREMVALEEPGTPIRQVAFSPDGRRLVALDYTNRLWTWFADSPR